MRTIEIADEAKLAGIVANIPKDTAIVMLNLLKFNDRADYPENSGVEPCSGRDAYMKRYIVPAKPYLKEAGGENIYQSEVPATVIGPEQENWDAMLLFRYPSIDAFIQMVSTPHYQELRKHRKAALEDSRLIATIETPLYEA